MEALKRKEAYKKFFEDTAKKQVWVKKEEHYFIPMLDQEIAGSKKKNFDSALECAKNAQMTMLSNWAVDIVGEGNEYRGVTAKRF